MTEEGPSVMGQQPDSIFIPDDESSYIKEECDSIDGTSSIAGIFLTNSDINDDALADDAATLQQICRSCLSNNTIELTESLSAAFTQATGVSLSDARYPRRLCRRCAAYVRKFIRFKEASWKADAMLKDLLDRGMNLKSSISILRNKSLKFFPILVKKHNLPNYFDAHYIHEDNLNTILNHEQNCDGIKTDDLEFKTPENVFECSENVYSDPDSIYEEEDLISLNQINSKTAYPIKSEENPTKQENIIENHTREQPKKTKLKKVRLKRIRNDKSQSELKKNKLIKQKRLKTKVRNKIKDGAELNVQIEDKEYVTRKYKKSGKHTKDDELFEEFFKIETLTLQQQKDDFVRRKETANYSNSKLKCEFCFKGFMHERAYDAHMAKHSEKMGELTCKVCHRHCPSNKVLRKHMDHHKYKFSCKKCSYETKARSSAKLHIDWHNGKQYDCDKCGQIFTRISTLLSHARIKHPTDHVCGLCGYSFLGEKGIYFHTSLKHRLDDLTIPADGPQCTDCDVRFANEDALFTHQRVSPRHGECKRNDAPPVPPKFKRQPKSKDGQGDTVRKETRGRRPLQSREPKNRRQPDYTATTAVPLHCEQCGMAMNSGTEYRVHFQKYHPNCTRTMFPQGSKPSLCDICGKMFKTPAILNEHMSEHTNMPAPHTCDECGKSFRKKSSLALHRNVHLGRRYPCPICGKCFNQVCNRDRHYTYVHSAVKDVKCEYCSKCFKSDEERKLHTTYVHFKKPYPKRSRARRHDLVTGEQTST